MRAETRLRNRDTISRILRLLASLLAVLTLGTTLLADFVVHSFSLWGATPTYEAKRVLLVGWSNGFLYGRKDSSMALTYCLNELPHPQIIAMVDKYYKDHPEKWSLNFGEQMLNTVTIPGGSCAGKMPDSGDLH